MRLASALAAVAVAAGCPLFQAPPFDASGIYHGAWEGEVFSDFGDDAFLSCPCTIYLEHTLDCPVLKWRPQGTV